MRKSAHLLVAVRVDLAVMVSKDGCPRNLAVDNRGRELGKD
jgi:hypothetical protein